MDDSKKTEIAKREEETLRFWKDADIFNKSVNKEANDGDVVFYDGPPFATGTPHYGHLVPGTVKDVIPKYQTMKGKKVVRRWGWDCHGLPIEKLIQEENNLNSKEDIEKFGIENFNNKARANVFKYNAEWKEIIPRTGRFVDMENVYTTMDTSYSQSVIWMFKELYSKGLIYEGFKSMHISPKLETPLSNFEVNLGYKDITDISVTVKFELVEEQGTYILAWTTTPWTLPGNAALAVNSSIEYVKVKSEGGQYILAKEALEKEFEGKEYTLVDSFTGDVLVGKKYRPIFDYYFKKEDLENRENGWKVYDASFVEVSEGTGVVHIAPGFGSEDLELSMENKIPIISHVKMDGRFVDDVSDFKGLEVKPKDDHQRTDIEIIKYLASKDKLFSKKKITHSYPHCWRTDAPLINYAMSSWYVKVTDIKEKLIKENQKVNWVPENVGKNRFGNWLEEAKDWSISRSRYWGNPLPVWKNEDGDVVVLGSLEEIKEKTKSTNKYFIMRHGQATSNEKEFVSSDNTVQSNLTEKGVEVVKNTALHLSQKPDVIITSPLTRTLETAQIVADTLGISRDKIVVDKRIQETQVGENFNGKPISNYRNFFDNQKEKFFKTPAGGENLLTLKKRVGDFIYDIDSSYKDQTILIITHEYVVWMLESIKDGLDVDKTVLIKEGNDDFVPTGHAKEYEFAKIPHNDDYELDFHRPYIDDISFEIEGKRYKRVEDVFDTWVDSGSVPFASNGYPLNKDNFNPPGFLKKGKGYPADFIAEGLDQTRGWFYTMLVLNTALFDKAPYKNVMVSGLVLAEDGRKMSKSLKNYPEITEVLDKYGADALRFFLINSPVVRAEDLLFSEKGVDEVVKKILNRLLNVYTFYELNLKQEIYKSAESTHALDRFILERLKQTKNQVTESLDKYEIGKAIRPFISFIDELSTWYIRRSRDRFKEGDIDAFRTTKYVLDEISKLMAPFIPFISEYIYQKINGYDFKEFDKSVHLENWPQKEDVDMKIIEQMDEVRDIVNSALEARSSEGIKVRQPLQKITVKANEFDNELVEILKDEINVKEVIFNNDQKEKVILDTKLTKGLLEEGAVRDIIRLIQSQRKDAKLNPNDLVALSIHIENPELIEKHEEEIMRATNLNKIQFEENDGQELKVLDSIVRIKLII